MRIVRLDPADEDALRACHEVQEAVQAADDPHEPPMSPAVFRVWVFNGWDGNPSEVWAVPGGTAGRMIAWYRLDLPDLENQDRSHLLPNVHPAFRRAGIGRELLRHAAARATANGRSVLGSEMVQDSPGEAFARRVGAKLGLVEARRVLELRTVPAGQFARLREEAAAKAAGYTVVRWTGPTPEKYVDVVAEAFNAMNDAPRDEGYEDDIWDADRIRDRADHILRHTDVRGYSVAAVHDATGAMAGLSQVDVDPAHPEWGHQSLTAVTRPHRGHRLGLLTKASMLEWLATAEPQIDRIVTGNAESNKHMIAVNEALGYQLHGPGCQMCEIPVEAAAHA